MAKHKIKVPYSGASSGAKARDEITQILANFGCESVGFMDDFAEKAVVLAFKHRGRPVQLRASAKGWAQLWLKAHPHSTRKHKAQAEYEERALNQGLIAVNSILRDWVKGQVTAVETGILSFEAVFFSHMITKDGRTVIDTVSGQGLLPPPKDE